MKQTTAALLILQVKANIDVVDCVEEQIDNWMHPECECEEPTVHEQVTEDINDWFGGSCAQRGGYRPRDCRSRDSRDCRDCSSDSSDEFDFDKELIRLKNECFSDISCDDSDSESEKEKCRKKKKRMPVKQSICLKPKVD